MKVLVVSSKFPPEYAGSGFRAHRTYQRLAKKYEINYNVLCGSVEFDSGAEYFWEGAHVKRICSKYFRIGAKRRLPLLSRLYRNLKYYHEFFQALLWLRKEKFDCIHIFSISPVTAAAAHFAHYYGIPMIMEVCNNSHDPSPFIKWSIRFLKADLNKGTIIVAISQQLKELCDRLGYKKNVWCRPNPIDENHFYFKAEVEKQKNRGTYPIINSSDRVAIYIAKFWPQKNHIFLIDVLKRLPKRYKLILAGPLVRNGPHAKRDLKTIDDIKRRIQQLNLMDRILLISEFVKAEEYLSIGDVYLFPSWNEALGTPLLESLACGLPVVANAAEPAFRQWIVPGENGFLCNLDPKEWAIAIQKCEEFTEYQKQKYSKKILSVASSKVIDRKYMDLLQYLVSNRPLGLIDVKEELGTDF